MILAKLGFIFKSEWFFKKSLPRLKFSKVSERTGWFMLKRSGCFEDFPSILGSARLHNCRLLAAGLAGTRKADTYAVSLRGAGKIEVRTILALESWRRNVNDVRNYHQMLEGGPVGESFHTLPIATYVYVFKLGHIVLCLFLAKN